MVLVNEATTPISLLNEKALLQYYKKKLFKLFLRLRKVSKIVLEER